MWTKAGTLPVTALPARVMASSYPPPFEGAGEVKEGFLCPLCLKDLQSFYQLQEHYEEEHSGDDGHVKGQIKSKFWRNIFAFHRSKASSTWWVIKWIFLWIVRKIKLISILMKRVLSYLPLWTGLVQKAKKAKDKLLKRDGDDRPDTGSYESFYYGGVDPYMWEPQELGDLGDSSEVCLISEGLLRRLLWIEHRLSSLINWRSDPKSPGLVQKAPGSEDRSLCHWGQQAHHQAGKGVPLLANMETLIFAATVETKHYSSSRVVNHLPCHYIVSVDLIWPGQLWCCQNKRCCN